MTGDFPSFEAFFTEVRGHAPYRWQTELAMRLRDTGEVGAVAVPTGLGKTSMIDAWVWALAAQVHDGVVSFRLPRRLVFAVERRVIVDDVAVTTSGLAARLRSAGPGSACAQVAAALVELSGDEPLISTSFHGSHRDDRLWLDATAVSVVTATLSQVTLRLIGQAPATGRGMASVHAGLLGVDTLIVIDEPHLAAAQVRSISDILELQSDKTRALGVPASRLTVLGATVPPEVVAVCHERGGGMIGFDPAVESDLSRFHAPRPARVVPVPSVSVGPTVSALVTEALGACGTDRRVAVVVNTVEVAEKVCVSLREKVSKKAFVGTHGEIKVDLVTGRMRPVDRPDSSDLGVPGVITVATQVVEVGVDFCVDSLITELTGWPSLTQRVGRLNRDGSAVDPECVIVTPVECKGSQSVTVGRKDSAAIYSQDSLSACLSGLCEVAGVADLTDPEVEDTRDTSFTVDMSLSAQSALTAAVLSSGYVTRSGVDPDRAVWGADSMPARVTDRLASAMGQTTTPGLEATPFLTGVAPRQTSLTVSIVWRTPVGPVEDGSSADRLRLSVDLAPVTPGEVLELPLPAARMLLDGEATDPTAALVDSGSVDDGLVDGVSTGGKELKYQRRLSSDVLVQRGGQWLTGTAAGRLKPGDMVVVEAGQQDRSDAHLRAILGQGRGKACVTVEGLKDAGVPVSRIDELFTDATGNPRPSSQVCAGLSSELSTMCGDGVTVRELPGVLVASFGTPNSAGDSADVVTLIDHSVDVAEAVQDSAARLGLSCAPVLYRAGLFHDAGKAVDSFQTMLGGLDTDPLLAKSTGRVTVLAAQRPGFRHEFASVNAMEHAGVVAPDVIDDELVSWLVLDHHGRARGVSNRRSDTAAAAQRRSRLEQVYGVWGLMYLEAVLRLADHRVSAYPVSVDRQAPDELVAVLDTLVDGGPADTDEVSGLITAGAAQAHPQRLDGLADGSEVSWWTALGLLSLVTDLDDSASLGFDGRTPVITTAVDLTGDLVRTLVEKYTSGLQSVIGDEVLHSQGFKWMVGAKPDQRPLSHEEIVGLSFCLEGPDVSGSVSRSGAALIGPHIMRLPKEDSSISAGALTIPHSNSSLGKMLSTLSLTFNPDCLWDLSSGWGGDRDTSGDAALTDKEVDKACQAYSEALKGVPTALGRMGLVNAGDPTSLRGGVGPLFIAGVTAGVHPGGEAVGAGTVAPGDSRIGTNGGRLRRVLPLPQVGQNWTLAAFDTCLLTPVRVERRYEVFDTVVDNMRYSSGPVLC